MRKNLGKRLRSIPAWAGSYRPALLQRIFSGVVFPSIDGGVKSFSLSFPEVQNELSSNSW